MTKNLKTKNAGEQLRPTPEAKEADVLRSIKKEVDKKFEKELQKLSLPEGYLTNHKVFEKALKIVEKENPKLLQRLIHRSPEMLKKISPYLALELIKYYKTKPYAKDILISIAENDPGAIIGYIDDYKTQPYAKDVLMSVAEKDPGAALEFADHYKTQHYAKDILMLVAEEIPQNTIKFVDRYAGQSYTKDVIKKASDEYPWAFEKNFKKIKKIIPDEAYPLLKRCEEHIKIAEKGFDLPQQLIRRIDFPMDRKKFELYLLGANHKSIESTTFKKGGYPLITISMPEFKKIFFSQTFQNFMEKQANKMSYMNAFSLTQAVYRKLEREKKALTEESIETTTESIFEQWERVGQRELFGPNTQLILFTHKEKRFDNKEILDKIYYRSGGKKENILVNAKGVEMEGGKNVMKERVLKAIRNSKGSTTILFTGHGSPENWSFSANQANMLDQSLKPHPSSINYQELGDAIIASKNIKNINLVGDACFTYDYILNVFRYLESKGVIKKPYASISSSNKAKYGWIGGKELDSRLLEALYNVSKEGKSIRVHHFFKAEAHIWRYEDPALFIGNPEKYKMEEKYKLSPPETKTIPKTIPSKAEPSPIIPEALKGKPTEMRPKKYLEIAKKGGGVNLKH